MPGFTGRYDPNTPELISGKSRLSGALGIALRGASHYRQAVHALRRVSLGYPRVRMFFI